MASAPLFDEGLLYDPMASVNVSCGMGRMECDILKDFGPPPNMILSMPPPPVPPSLEELVSRLAADAGVPEVVIAADGETAGPLMGYL